jgi:hypothetical protein
VKHKEHEITTIIENGRRLFPLGMYGTPRDETEWQTWYDAGIRLIPCGTREALDNAARHGMYGWAHVPMCVNNADDEKKLRDAVNELKDHPALMVWQAPDEIIHHASKVTGDPSPVYEPWYMNPEDQATWRQQLDTVVTGLLHGSEIVRELDPERPTWLNDTSEANRDCRARVASAFDIMGFDSYPVGRLEDPPIDIFGHYIDNYQEAAPQCEVWPIMQAFAWSTIRPWYTEAYPTRTDLRFGAWQSLTRGVSALFWWGIHLNEPGPFTDLVYQTIREIHEVNDLLLGHDLPSVQVQTHYLRTAPVRGVNHVARRCGDRVLLALINEDPWYHNAVVSGLEEAGIDDPNDLHPLTPDDGKSQRLDGQRLIDTDNPPDQFIKLDGGWLIPVETHGVRVWTT